MFGKSRRDKLALEFRSQDGARRHKTLWELAQWERENPDKLKDGKYEFYDPKKKAISSKHMDDRYRDYGDL